ncbi:hypothetical protein PHYC_03115 [Phycisphaerales bacterium]|nr:hypothetical protein PHYC_03115 [Phycisphaerales bacterium]
MECPNCNFQNVPGLRACARCQSLLDFSSISIDPPRAADVALPSSVRHAAARAGLSLRQSWAAFLGDTRSVFHPDVNWGALTRSVIPGWGHHRLGHRKFGWCIVGVWLALIALTLLLMGGPGGRPMYFLLVGWHGLIISLILARPLRDQPVLRRALLGLLVYALLNFGLYLPARWLITGGFVPFTIIGIAERGVLREGDTVVHTGRWNRPDTFHPGEIIVYQVQPLSAPGAYIRAGVGIDRIIAGPGDAVTSDGSVLSVNAAPIDPTRAPLGHLPPIGPFGVTLGPGEYFVLPSLFLIQGQQTRGFNELFVRVSIIRQEHITGKVLWRSRPWSRFGPIEQPTPSNTNGSTS